MSATFLARARVDSTGPAFFKAGHTIVYGVKDLERWADARKRYTTGRAAERGT